jgi:hypothetical protein
MRQSVAFEANLHLRQVGLNRLDAQGADIVDVFDEFLDIGDAFAQNRQFVAGNFDRDFGAGSAAQVVD